MIQAIESEAEILFLYVPPTFRCQGFARKIMQAFLNSMETLHKKSLRVSLEVRASNTPAIKLYHSLGFVELGRRRKYYRDGEDALLLVKRNTR